MKKFNHYRFSFENLFFQYLKKQIELADMITQLYDYEELARNEYAESKGELNEEMNEVLQEMGLCFRWFEGDTGIMTIRNLETDLSLYGNGANPNNRKYALEMMNENISLNTDFELQIYFA